MPCIVRLLLVSACMAGATHCVCGRMRLRVVTDMTAELFIQSRAEISRQREALRVHWGHSHSLDDLQKIAAGVRVPKESLDAALQSDREPSSVIIITSYPVSTA
jgi:hypothetical protein